MKGGNNIQKTRRFSNRGKKVKTKKLDRERRQKGDRKDVEERDK